MSERLNELRRQRALAQEQLAWFDREIAREQGPAKTAAEPLPTSPAVPVPEPADAPPDRQADQIMAQYRNQGRSIQSEVRRGCFLYFGAAFALLVTALVVFYLLRHR